MAKKIVKDETVEDQATPENVEAAQETRGGKVKTLLKGLASTKKRKILTITVGVLALLVIIFTIPFTRYLILSPFVKKDVSVVVLDSKTNKPVSNAEVILGDITSQSDKDGKATLKSVPVGEYTLKIEKEYYQNYESNYTVPVISAPQTINNSIVATGRQVKVSVTNSISKGALANVVIDTGDTKATTDDEGLATIILPPTDQPIKATLTRENYNTTSVELKVDESVVNAYAITSAGSINYLSKATGKINVMKANLDGTDAKAVVAGTGQESDYETSLLSSRDWKYSALLATRTDNKPRLYLLDATKDELTVMDEGDATFNLVGWSGHNFIYTVDRNNIQVWGNKNQALKSYNAETKKITTLDETTGSGSNYYDAGYENFGTPYILKNELVYLKYWNQGTYYQGQKKDTIFYSVNPAGGTKKPVQTFSNNTVAAKLYKPEEVYLSLVVNFNNNTRVFFEYEDGTMKQDDTISPAQFDSYYATFLMSPTGKQTFWYEQRDGKNVLFVGNASADDAKTIGNSSDYVPYGWYGENDEYILLAKNNSELYISSPSKVIGEDDYQPLKITDYHKTRTYAGYGYGYGGQ